jgi:hypothetical protein
LIPARRPQVNGKVERFDASISLRLEFPVFRWLEGWEEVEEGEPVDASRTVSLILGADAQTLSWSYVLSRRPTTLDRSRMASAYDASGGQVP